MTANQLVKVSPPVHYKSVADAPASFLAADLRVPAVPGVHEHRQWVFVRVGHGKGPWDAVGGFPQLKTVSMDTICLFRKHPVFSACFRGRLRPSRLPPKSPMSRVVYKATGASFGVAGKGRGCVAGLARAVGVRPVHLGGAHGEFQPPPRHRGSFFRPLVFM